jgi:hypothetical protein
MIEPAACLGCYHSPKHVEREFVSPQSATAKVRQARLRQADGSAVTASPMPGRAHDADAYRLSRIQAEGWNAARVIAASALDKLDATQIELLNPYKSDPERTRWSTGFTSALAS